MKFISTETSNIFQILNFVGEKNLWNAESVNQFFTKQSNSKLSPTTIHSRLQSLCRITDFVFQRKRDKITNLETLDTFKALIHGAEKSLLRIRKRRTKVVMSRNREICHHTLLTLQSWRGMKQKCHQFLLLKSFSKGVLNTLNQNEYDDMRNFLILEVLLENGQRSGIISGMTVKEVHSAENHVSSDGYHSLMVAEHKTGHIHSEIPFLFPDVFQAMWNFVKHLLPNIHHYSLNLTLFNKSIPVFQTFLGNQLTHVL